MMHREMETRALHYPLVSPMLVALLTGLSVLGPDQLTLLHGQAHSLVGLPSFFFSF